MKVAVLSDIHSNYHAFRACYEDAVKHHVEQFVFLGDYVSDLAEPEKTMDLIYEIQAKYPTVCLRGNREGYMLACRDGAAVYSRGSKSGSLLFTYEHLREHDFAFFSSLKISDTIALNGVQIQIAHATTEDDRFYFDCEDGNMVHVFSRMKCAYLLSGHSHKQYVRSEGGKTIINPGSVGIPQDGSAGAKYAIVNIDGGEISCTLREVPYDIGAAIHSQFVSGLVDYAKYWAIGILYDIITGDEWVLKLLRRVQELGTDQDERAWQAAAMELGMKFTETEIEEVGANCGLLRQGKPFSRV